VHVQCYYYYYYYYYYYFSCHVIARSSLPQATPSPRSPLTDTPLDPHHNPHPTHTHTRDPHQVHPRSNR
jgi:hypothetical protein